MSRAWAHVASLLAMLCAHAAAVTPAFPIDEYVDGRYIGAAPNDPAPRAEVVRSFEVPTGYATGIAWDGTSLFVADGSSLGIIYRLDPADGTVLGSYDIGIVNLRGLTMGGGFLWVASWGTESIYKLDPVSGRILDSFPAPFSGKPDGLAWDGSTLWIGEEGETEAGPIHHIDPESWTVLGSIVPPSQCCFNPRGLAWTPTGMWVGYQSIGRIYKIDPANGGSLGWIEAPSGPFQQGVTYDGQYLWSTGGDNLVYQIDIGKPVSVEATHWGAIKARYR